MWPNQTLRFPSQTELKTVAALPERGMLQLQHRAAHRDAAAHPNKPVTWSA